MIDTLCRLLDAGVTQFHVVKESEDILLDHDYRKLEIGERWELQCWLHLQLVRCLSMED